jgi:acyl-CoA hydrolase/RimJ/RimL family protein N-acetyltransferase
MVVSTAVNNLGIVAEQYPEKIADAATVFKCIRPGARIFIGTGCGEPQYLVQSLINYVESNPKSFLDAELMHVVTLGVAPYTDSRFKTNFRCNALFIGDNVRNGVNRGLADYTPVFLSEAPSLIANDQLPIDVALIQTSTPDKHGYMSLGVSVDIVKAAVEKANIVIAQVNRYMPRVHGSGFVHISKIDHVIRYDEPILEYENHADVENIETIGRYVNELVQDGDVIQIGYGKLPNAVVPYLAAKRHLGVHTELLSDRIIELMQSGAVDNSEKTINCGKTIASFCMGKQSTYDYIHDNPMIELRTIDYTNNPLVIAQHKNMTAINSVLQIDLTGQATAESIGATFYSGIGGQADFMRGAVLAPGGKTILVISSTTQNGKISRIVPLLGEGTGVTLNRGDIHYVVTEYGIAYLHGKNIRERAMSLIAIAHPKFRPWLVEEAKRHCLVYEDQAVMPGKGGEYPVEMETYRRTRNGTKLLFRPVKISDEPLLKDFFYGLSDQTMLKRFASSQREMPHKRLQGFTVIDYTRELEIMAILQHDLREEIVGIGWCYADEKGDTAEVAFAVKDEYQGQGIGTELLEYLCDIGMKRGVKTIFAEVLTWNDVMIHVFEKAGFKTTSMEAGMLSMQLELTNNNEKESTFLPVELSQKED